MILRVGSYTNYLVLKLHDMRRGRIVILACAIGAGGCALNPPPPADELRTQSLPNFKPPANWTGAVEPPGGVGNGWLASFNDPTLDALVAEALACEEDRPRRRGRLRRLDPARHRADARSLE